MTRHRGRHRAPSTTGRTLARTAAAGAAFGAPLLSAIPAQAAPDNLWDQVAQCESSGNWAINTGNGFSGGLQFTPSTWTGFGGAQFAPAAYEASRDQQIVVAERVLAAQGWGAWPVCSVKAGAVGTPATLRATPAPAPAAVQAPARAAVPSAGGTYTVQPGDTLSDIAAAHGVTWQNLAASNHIADPDQISPGQLIAV
jgi:resuscitation-promoting factor RpfA